MLQLPQQNARTARFSRADLIDIGNGAKVQKPTRRDPIIDRIEEFNSAFAAYHDARARVEEIMVKHPKEQRLFGYAEVFLPGADLLTIARNVRERRFVTIQQIDHWGKERTAYFSKKARQKRFKFGEGSPKLFQGYVDRVAFLVPRLKAALRKAERERRAFQKRTGYDVANKKAYAALERLFNADKRLDRISPRTTAGAIAAIKFASDQIRARSANRTFGLYGLNDCAGLMERAMAAIEKTKH